MKSAEIQNLKSAVKHMKSAMIQKVQTCIKSKFTNAKKCYNSKMYKLVKSKRENVQ